MPRSFKSDICFGRESVKAVARHDALVGGLTPVVRLSNRLSNNVAVCYSSLGRLVFFMKFAPGQTCPYVLRVTWKLDKRRL